MLLLHRTETAKTMRKEAEETFKALTEANEILAKLAQNVKKKEMEDEVTIQYHRVQVS